MDGPPNDTTKALALAQVATPMRGCGAGSHLLPEVVGTERDREVPVFSNGHVHEKLERDETSSRSVERI